MTVPANVVDKTIAIVEINIGRPGDTTLDDYVIEWINWAQKQVCNRMNFWFMRANTTLSFVLNDLSKALPSDFKDEDGVYIQDADTDEFIELEYMDYLDYRRVYNDVTTGQPSHYVLDGSGNILIRPVPDQSYTIVLDYWKYLTDLVASGSSNKLLADYPEVLEAGATYRGFRYLTEWEDAERWKNIFEESIQDLKVTNADRELPDEMIIRPRSDVYGSGIRKTRGRVG